MSTCFSWGTPERDRYVVPEPAPKECVRCFSTRLDCWSSEADYECLCLTCGHRWRERKVVRTRWHREGLE